MIIVTTIYAFLMFALGLVGFLSNPAKAQSSLIVGTSSLIIFLLLAYYMKKSPKRARRLVTLLGGLLSLMLVWRTNMTWMAYFGGESEKLLAGVLMGCMLVASLVITGLGIVVKR